ncbi:tRNA (guanosine(46)-N7)-methyltransferase TrmB [Prochlorococcus sp. MIT 1300]|uniref:tRNA (guanosine(46)-N7)-methyltransferase TrmB n=1 Tax=Prochlorococcus sp. MIT 1300 TaxID=3096218 RepID=UPI002A74DDF8|nr:tRNA (guanosine(46)-N7)-methyltransferase TrmB [Prochlorococcus sp. MIT 1300]
MRQHVNPLSRFFQLPRSIPRPEELFEDYDMPLHLDIGSARGKFLLELAPLQLDWNHIGVEIRHPLVLSSEREREQLGIANLRFLFCNANVSLDAWLNNLSKQQLHRVTIQFPDPWFKRKHKKRRVLQPKLLLSIANALSPGKELFIQSDLLSVIDPMLKLIEMSNCFERIGEESQAWLTNNPMSIATEREIYASQNGSPIYRALFLRNKNSIPTLSLLEEEWDVCDCN